jgi:hypothetical protein
VELQLKVIEFFFHFFIFSFFDIFILRAEASEEPFIRTSTESSNDSTISSDITNGWENPSEKKVKTEKHVTFDAMVVEPKPNSSLRKRKHRDLKNSEAMPDNRPKQDIRVGKPRMEDGKLESKIEKENSCIDEVDLCALLESIPIDPPPEVKTEEEKEIVESVNRLSAYDNLSFDDKLKIIVQRQNSDDHSEKPEGIPNAQPYNVHISAEGSNCKMCGLMKKKKKSKHYNGVYSGTKK